MNILNREYYLDDAETVAKNLLGKYIVREYDNKKIVCKIVETEAYKTQGDKAAHANNNKLTERTKIIFEEGGHAYIYLIYGMYYCFNVVVGPKGGGGAILIRAVEPVDGIEHMMINRFNEINNKKMKDLTNGPGKLCIAMNINKSLYGEDLCNSSSIYIVEGENIEEENIVYSKRINIDYAEEAIDFLWRYYIRGNKYVSKK